MRIFLDGTPLLRERSGVGQYTKYLLEALLAADSQNQYTIYAFASVKAPVKGSPLDGRANLKFRHIRYFPREGFNILIRKLGWVPPIDLMMLAKPDLFLFPNFVRFPLALGERSMVFVYDISYELFPQYVSPGNREYLHKGVAGSIKKAQRVITISEHARKEIIDFYQLDPAKVEIINPAVDSKIFYRRDQPEVAVVSKKYHLPKEFILFTGNIEPRKNIIGLIDAYITLPQATKNRYALVLAGGRGWRDEEILARLETAKVSGAQIFTTGYVADEDLSALYSAASLFAYPSFYEGFGIPPLEAMACGVPVVTSNTTSLPEVVGDAAIMVDPNDTTAISKAMEQVLTDPTLAAELRKKGFAQAKVFSWEASAQKLLGVMKELGS